MKVKAVKGWVKEPARHSLAARGLKTTVVKRRYPSKARSVPENRETTMEYYQERLAEMYYDAEMDVMQHENEVRRGWDKLTREHLYGYECMLEGTVGYGKEEEAKWKEIEDLIFKEAEKINDLRETVGLGRLRVMFASTRAEGEAEEASERAFDALHEQ